MYLLEINKSTGIHSEEVAVAAELLSKKAWMEMKENSDLFQMVDLRDLCNNNISPNAVPVGSIEFCERILGRRLSATNIPKGLRDPMYTGRKVTDADSSTLSGVFKKYSAKELFVKSATQCKCSYTGIYKPNDKLPEDKYFVSEVMKVEAEWRCFVWRGQILDIRRYAGDYTAQLSNAAIQMVKNMVTAAEAEFNHKMPAYVIDIGVIENKELPVIIEVHNFIACGLYGFHDYRILGMMKDGAAAERSAEARAQNRGGETT